VKPIPKAANADHGLRRKHLSIIRAVPNDADHEHDDLIIGAGMAGLVAGALLAARGRRVLLLEAHDSPGGYAHTFAMGKYRFCAQVHYIFHCGEGEPIYGFLRQLGLENTVRFHRLDPEGFDHIVVAGERYRIPTGLDKFRDRLIYRFPQQEAPLRRYFRTIQDIGREVDVLPKSIGWGDLLTAPLRFPNLLRYKGHTLQQLYDQLQLSPRLQTILAGQCGDYLLPPDEVSLLLHVALVRAYDRGAYYPEQHFQHFIGSVVDFIRAQPGCALRLQTAVERFIVERGRVTGVVTTDGQAFSARRYISNVDPQRTAAMLPKKALPPRYLQTLSYDYSAATITLYLGIRGLDLRQHDFGSHNVWHYPNDDISATYRRQLVEHDFRDPWLFMSTPTLHTGAPGLCPPGEQILEIATSADYAHFAGLREHDRRGYNQEKKRIRDSILQLVEEQYIPNLRQHLVLRAMGTPATNARFCRAPFGNSYGSALRPKNVRHRVPFQTPIGNLWLVGATAGYPSIGGTVQAAMELVKLL
jgi:all-trans-retinol 13,14-reductase